MGAGISNCNNKWIIGKTLGQNYNNENTPFLLTNCYNVYINTSKSVKSLKTRFLK